MGKLLDAFLPRYKINFNFKKFGLIFHYFAIFSFQSAVKIKIIQQSMSKILLAKHFANMGNLIASLLPNYKTNYNFKKFESFLPSDFERIV
jgi:hypothetical protein